MTAPTVEEVAELRQRLADLELRFATFAHEVEGATPKIAERRATAAFEEDQRRRAAERLAAERAAEPQVPAHRWVRIAASPSTIAALGRGVREIEWTQPRGLVDEHGLPSTKPLAGDLSPTERVGLTAPEGAWIVAAEVAQTLIAKAPELAKLVAGGVLVVEELPAEEALRRERRLLRHVAHERIAHVRI